MSVGEAVAAYAGLIGAVISAVALVWTMRSRAADKAAQESRERAQLAGEKYAEGARSRDDEIRLLRSERDEARRDAEGKDRLITEAKNEAQRWQQAYFDRMQRRGE